MLGGLAILAGVWSRADIWMPSSIMLPTPRMEALGSAGTVHTWGVIAGAALIALRRRARRRPRPALDDQAAGPGRGGGDRRQVGGAVITDVTIPFVGSLQFTDGAGPLTVIWLVALMNIVNFSDGVDGLAAGVCTIDGVAFAVIAFSLQGPASAAAVLAAITAGGALGFLFHNFYPAKVFMGDTGANLLGYLLGVVAVIGSIKTTAVVALAVPLLILAVPFLDTGFVVAKRLKYRRKPWAADAEHFHHRMARIGFSPRRTVAYLYAWTVMLAGVAIALRFVPYSDHHCRPLPLRLVGRDGSDPADRGGGQRVPRLRARDLQVQGPAHNPAAAARPDTSEEEIDETVERDVETGEFEAVKGETGEFEEVKIPEPHE